jgi:cobalt transporter subunit CbtA
MFFAAILVGLAGGLVMSAMQYFRVTPYILAAEAYEHKGAHEHSNASGQPAAEVEPWAPVDGLERTAYTVLANSIVSIAFALLMIGASFLLNLPITVANGALWGLCGFMVFSLAPSAGLPPELPGMPAADLSARQVWWWFAVAATAGGLTLLAKKRSPGYLVLAILLIALPHLIGAPDAPSQESNVPAQLASGFAANALATAAVFWVFLGLGFGLVHDRATRRRTVP